MNSSDELIKIIDSRIEKFFQNKNISIEYSGKVISVSGNYATVKISGYDTEFRFLNKTGEILNSGDSVYVKAIGGKLTNGIISYKFGE